MEILLKMTNMDLRELSKKLDEQIKVVQNMNDKFNNDLKSSNRYHVICKYHNKMYAIHKLHK